METYQEETILAGMIMSKEFLSQVIQIYRPELIQSKYVKTVADWCINYWNKYETNPGNDIDARYRAALKDGINDAESEAIAKLLETINSKAEKGRYTNFNVEHALDVAENYFKKRSIESLKESIEFHFENDDVHKAEEEILSYGKVQRVGAAFINSFTNEKNLEESFESRTPLYEYPGAYGELINEFLIREGFVAYLGPEKIGKTWNLIDHAMRATANKLNVVYISAGDQNTHELALRQAVYIAGRSNLEKYSKEVKKPVLDCQENQLDTCRLSKRTCRLGLLDTDSGEMYTDYIPKGYKSCSKCSNRRGFKPAVLYQTLPEVNPLTSQEAKQTNGWWSRVRMKNKDFKMVFYPEGTVNVAEINTELTNLSYAEDWVPDVIIIDYADTLDKEPGCSNYSERDAQNARWMAMRRLSQEWHALLITATQADADSYDQGLLLRKNFSEDKRKYAHSTVTIGLNQTPEEKDRKLNRKNIIMAREGEYNPFKTVTCLECLQRGMPYINSYYTPSEERKKVKYKKEA